MKLTCIFALFTLSVIVRGNMLVAVAQPVILSLGTIYAAFNQDLLPFTKKNEEEISWLDALVGGKKEEKIKEK